MRDIDNVSDGLRQHAIEKIMVSYGYDAENAEKVYEIMRVKQVEKMWGISCGALALYKWLPIQRELEAGQAMWRKTWMRYPLTLSVFSFAYFLGTQMPSRFFQKFTRRDVGISTDTYMGQGDLVVRFRLFDNEKQTKAED